MAKTIKELSYKYASDFMKEVDKVNAEQRKWLRRHKDETPPSGGVKACFIFQRSAYEAGANAMLEEVEKAIDLGKYPDLISPTEALFKVTQLVIRLKG